MKEDDNVPLPRLLLGHPLELSKSPAWAFNWLHDVGMTGAIAFTAIMWWHGHLPELAGIQVVAVVWMLGLVTQGLAESRLLRLLACCLSKAGK